jgi:replicative DNA helicase
MDLSHDYFQDVVPNIHRLSFGLHHFNLVTKGGLPGKTLTAVMASPGQGSTLLLCHFAVHRLVIGSRVLYLTMAVPETSITARMDANLLNVSIDELGPNEHRQERLAKHRSHTPGRLIIHEYPTGTASTNEIRALLADLKEQDFVPDIIYVDFLNVCASARLKFDGSMPRYVYVQAVAEELKALAMEHDIPIFTAAKTNRLGYANSDPQMTDMGESWGLPVIADFLFTIVVDNDLNSRWIIKQLKNLLGDVDYHQRWIVGVDKRKMRLYDIAQASDTVKSIMNFPPKRNIKI